MEFAADKYCAVLNGIKIFVESYSFARSSAVGETVLINSGVALHNGGGKAARIVVSGKAETSCAYLLDALLISGAAFSFEYGGMVFNGAVLAGYECKGESGKSETVTAELICTAQAVQKEAEA